jgi:hypothetical protein
MDCTYVEVRYYVARFVILHKLEHKVSSAALNFDPKISSITWPWIVGSRQVKAGRL